MRRSAQDTWQSHRSAGRDEPEPVILSQLRPGRAEATSHELGRVLNQLDYLVAARDAHGRWPNWTFRRQLHGWQARQADGSA